MTFGQDKHWRRNVRNHASPGMKVLEVGCGPGSFAEDLVGLDVTCLDPSAEMLAAARPRVDGARAQRGEAPAEYVEAIAEAIPLPDNTFDMVFCLFSFRDFKDKKQGLSEIFRVLKPGGRLVMCDAGKANKHGFFGYLWMNTVVQLLARLITREKNHPWKGLAKSYTHYGTNGYYRKMMKEVGFENVQGRLLPVRHGKSVSRHKTRFWRPVTKVVRLLNPLSLGNSTGVFHGYVRRPPKHQISGTRCRKAVE